METFSKQRGRGLLVGNLIARFEGLSPEQTEMDQDTNQVGRGGQVFVEHPSTGGGQGVTNRAQGQSLSNNVQKEVNRQGKGQGGAMPPMDPNAMNWLMNQVQERVQALMQAHMQTPNPAPNQGDVRTCRDFVMPRADLLGHSPIRLPPITANNMSIGQNIINMIRDNSTFRGTANENPYFFLDHFLEVCRTIRMDGVSEEAIKLLLFPFTLKDQARVWYDSLRHDSLHTWTEVVRTFLLKYYPPGKVFDLKEAIMTFDAYEDESLFEAWERYKALLRQCPVHGVTLGDQVHCFLRGLDQDMQSRLHASSGGDIMMLQPDQAFDQIERIAETSRLYVSETRRGPRRKKPSEMKSVGEKIEDAHHEKLLDQQEEFLQNLEDRVVQLDEKRRFEKEEETRKELEAVGKEREEAHSRKTERDDDDFYLDEAFSELEIELGSPMSLEAPLVEFDYGRFHVLPITPSLPDVNIDDALVECMVEPTIVKTQHEIIGDESNSFWDEEEMEEVQCLSITPPPEGMQDDDLEECMIDLSALFEESDSESKEKLGSPISPSLPIEVNEDVIMKSEVKSSEEPFMVELPEEVEIISMPVPDYYTLPPCVDWYYGIDFVYSPVEKAHEIYEREQLPWDGNFKKGMMTDFNERGFPRATRGKFLANSFSPMLAILILLELLIFLSSDFG